MKFSNLCLFISCLIISIISFSYYPKWNKQSTEATLSWDVSGYYWYLPAMFIYEDLRKLDFNESILQKYRPTPELQQAFKIDNGNYVLKYSCGQAVMMLPPFIIGHQAAKLFGYEADGFSMPYQFSIFLWGLIISILGLILLKKILMAHFDEVPVGLSLLAISIGTNFLEYGAITNSMTHNYLFTLYGLLIWSTVRFYNRPSFKFSIIIGVCLGLMALIRPSEIIAILIPILYGMRLNFNEIRERFIFLFKQFENIIIAIIIMLSIGSLQFLYWKFASGGWIVYSYEDQGFSWLRPHVIDGLFSGRAGWLIYSPIMIFSLIGFYPFIKRHASLAFGFTLFAVLFMYVTFAWDIWWYGGSIGQRALIQIYPVLAFPMASFFSMFDQVNIKSIIFTGFGLLALHFNIWVVHNAHYGGLLVAGEMTSDYLKAVALRNNLPEGAKKLLDTRKMYSKPIQNPITLLEPKDSTNQIANFCLNDSIQFSEAKKFKLPSNEGWLRAEASFYTENKEYDTWKMTQLVLKYYKDGEATRSDVLRAQRHIENGIKTKLHLDSKIRYKPDSVEVFLWNSDGKTQICVENLSLIYHKGE